MLAWLRLLVDPGDAGAVVRALARPPIELRSVDLARCVQIARRRKLDMVGALVAATESPQLPPEARERILRFLKLHRAAAGALDTTRPDLFVHRLVDRLGLRRQQLFAAQADVVERLRVARAELGDLATAHVRRDPQATGRDFARAVTAVAEAGLRDEEEDPEAGTRRDGAVAVLAMHAAQGREFRHVFVLGLQSARMPGARRHLNDHVPDALLHEPLPGDTRAVHVDDMRRLLQRRDDARARRPRARPSPSAPSAARCSRRRRSWRRRARRWARTWEERERGALRARRDAARDVRRAARRAAALDPARPAALLGELRLDTDLDIAHGTARYLELVKLAALMARPDGQPLADALPQINAALLQSATAQQREVLQTSSLDDLLLGAEADAKARSRALAARSRAVAGGVPAPARRRAAAQRRRHRDLPRPAR